MLFLVSIRSSLSLGFLISFGLLFGCINSSFLLGGDFLLLVKLGFLGELLFLVGGLGLSFLDSFSLLLSDTCLLLFALVFDVALLVSLLFLSFLLTSLALSRGSILFLLRGSSFLLLLLLGTGLGSGFILLFIDFGNLSW